MSESTPEWRAGLAVEGFTESVARFRDRSTGENLPGGSGRELPTNEIILPLVEALWWAVSADEEFSKLDQKYRARRDADDDGQVLPGVRYIRNRCGHQRALAIERQELTFPVRFPATFGLTFRWRRAADLPTPDPGREDKEGKAAYEEHLENRPADATLAHLEAWFKVLITDLRSS